MVLSGCKYQPLSTVSSVDLNQYVGLWYEIASFPQSFQLNCENTTATYSLTNNNWIKVENRCIRNGEKVHIVGKAFVQKNSNNAKLKVQFFWPFRGKYWIIDLDESYQYAVVGHPNRKYLWILSRTPNMDKDLLTEIVARTEAKGFDISKLSFTKQSSD